MIPTNSSGTTNGCDNISSNCVIWQGPDISCIDLCTGDTISEVTKKIGDKVCQIITDGVTANPSLTGLDLTCLNIPGITPTTLVPVLQAMVTQICANSNSVPSNPGGGGSSSLPMMVLPACLQYNDPSGNPVTELRLDEFATHIANQVCTNLASINTINSTLTSIDNRVSILEACVLPCSGTSSEVQIVPTCVSNVGQLTNVSVVVLALESAFCSLQNAVGLPAAINSAVNQTALTSSTTSLANSSTSYGSITGWNASPSTMAQSLQNAWVVIDDLYNALSNVQTNCCPSGCDGITFAYTTSTGTNSNGIIDNINFSFINSSIPNSFNDSAGFSKITVTDSLGANLTQTFSVSTLQNNPNGLNFNVSTLNTQGDMNVLVEFSVTDGADTCTANQSNVVPGLIPCPTPVTSNVTQTGVDVSFVNQIGATAVYIIDILDNNGVVAATYTINNPGNSVSHSFTGLSPSTTYTVRLTVEYGGQTQVCSATQVTFQTETGAAPCTNGMDVAFCLDYTGSMSDEINAIKTGFATLVNTIDTSSGSNNYRIGVMTVSEKSSANQTPTYATSTDYIALPAVQKEAVNGTAAGGNTMFFTAWEMFANNNGANATTQVNLLNTGSPPGGVPIGSGASNPEPMDLAISRVMNSNFLGAFRNNVAKYIICITDDISSGDDDQFTGTDYAFIQQLTNQANAAGIKIFVLGEGVNKEFNNGGTMVKPWRELAINTGGNWNQNEDPSTISAEIIAGCS
tara:strand:+ start:2797 stop:5025 length:2229 start_codon:yes stop_codon:yes gene_type:complete